MKFRTEVSVIPADKTINHYSKVMFAGSCFSEHIQDKLSKAGISCLGGTHGILFNPHSIAQALQDVLDKKMYSLQDLHHQGGLYWSWNHHGQFRSESASTTVDVINQSISDGHAWLGTCNYLFITLGTAWCYEREEEGVVANCHKRPQSEFIKRMLSVEEIVSKYKSLLNDLQQNNPNLQVVFTVSPVRHWKDGAIDNTRSKSTLHLAIQELQEISGVSYFPSYELIMDDLRDYRFYTTDLLHPNETAVHYIWEKFQQVFFTNSTKELVKEVEQYQRLKAHRVMGGVQAEQMHKEQVQRLKKVLEEKGVNPEF